jgi:shikimate dehydrogenase
MSQAHGMLDTYSGATRVIFIVGDPIAQVKAPRHFTAALRERGQDAIVVPAHVRADDLAGWIAAASAMANCDGVIVTVPHKFSALSHCKAASARARSVGAANVMRRQADGGWWGDHLDGEGYVSALREKGCDPRDRRVLLVGAGGAGSAIARALLDAGVSHLAVHDLDANRRDHLLARLENNGPGCTAGSADPQGFDIVINATPCGMRAEDPMPVLAGRLLPSQFVGDVVTAPEVTPLLAAARAVGCGTLTGLDMFRGVARHMVDFYSVSR